jgi:hypothetical protein
MTQEIMFNNEDFKDLMRTMSEHLPYEEIYEQARSKIRPQLNQEELDKVQAFFDFFQRINDNLEKFDRNIETLKQLTIELQKTPKIKTKRKTRKKRIPKENILMEARNNVSILWDELECFLQDDEDFTIERIENDKIIIRVLRKEAFNLVFIMAKIFGRILPFNARVRVDLKNYRGENYKQDSFILDFTIETLDDFYKGMIYVQF